VLGDADARLSAELLASLAALAALPAAVDPSAPPLDGEGVRLGPPPPPPLRTNRTRRVPHPVLIGHAASLTPY